MLMIELRPLQKKGEQPKRNPNKREKKEKEKKKGKERKVQGSQSPLRLTPGDVFFGEGALLLKRPV